ncbi:hypothetical protein [Streptomyces sp. NPDC006638]|uniref:hypothetical protein n=1 Tax=Streptomyces sp. NPDC006638 TaxID=3157183 RepID=UPI0033B1B1BF
MKKDWLLNGSLVAVLVVLASAEYQLARDCGFGKYVAAAVPVALDLYVVKALRVKRDVTAAVLALIAVNGASHLVSASVLPVRWPLIVAVSSIAPLVLWRIHRLGDAPAPVRADDHPAEVPAPQRYGDPVVFRPVPKVVPAGVELLPIVAAGRVVVLRSAPKVVPAGARMLPIVSAEVTTSETTEFTLERVGAAPQPVVTRPAIETGWHPLAWPLGELGRPGGVTSALAGAEARQVVTVPVTITPAELRRQARKLNRELVTATNKQVTIERLREEFGLSRREATDLRREVVGSRS